MAELPHDAEAFTQGLDFVHGKLLESTGLADSSSVRILSASTGEIELIKSLPGHWGEGIAWQADKVYQLTWQSKKVIVYSWPNLDRIEVLPYSGEGWGLTSCEDGFFMSNGSATLDYRDSNFEKSRSIKVRIRGLPQRWLNDLTYANGALFVNRLGDSCIYEVSADSGQVRRVIDCAELVKRTAPHGPEDFLNGVAYNSDSREFFVTGKRWPILFSVSIPP